MADLGADPRFEAVAGLSDLVLGPEDGPDGRQKRVRRLAYWQAATQGLWAPDCATERRLAADILALIDLWPADHLYGLRGPMLARAASAVRAGKGGDQDLMQVRDLTVSHAHRGFFGVEVMDYRQARFDGGLSPLMRREVFVAVDAVTVLPYDPISDRVLLVEQLRAAPLARGDYDIAQIEGIAGRIDAGETPEAAARREAAEEAGLELSDLELIAQYYPSPGALSEYLYSWLAICDLAQVESGLFGLAEEGEDIRTLILSFDEAMADLARGRFRNGPLMLMLLWLSKERERLRAAALAGL